jgi:hypothetical protein
LPEGKLVGSPSRSTDTVGAGKDLIDLAGAFKSLMSLIT